MHQIRQRRRLGEKGVMSYLMVSQTAILPGMEAKWDHDTVNDIMNGYYRPSDRQSRRRVTKLLHKSVMPKGELGQWTSDQVGQESRVTTRPGQNRR